MKRINNEIRDNFEHFIKLVEGKKIVSEKPISLEQKKTHKDWLTQTISANHETLNDKIDLTIERKKSVYKYGIKLTSKNFTTEPFFRFDSDGPAHRNISNNIPFLQQKITTPHFNSFNEKGIAIAYKSEILKTEKEADAIAENIDFGLNHFFFESNINKGEQIPTLELKVPELFGNNIETDPLNGVDFLI